MKITHAVKRIQQHIRMHVLYTAKHQFGRRGSKLGHSYIPSNHPRDDIDGLRKIIIIIFIFHFRIYFVAYLISIRI